MPVGAAVQLLLKGLGKGSVGTWRDRNGLPVAASEAEQDEPLPHDGADGIHRDRRIGQGIAVPLVKASACAEPLYLDNGGILHPVRIGGKGALGLGGICRHPGVGAQGGQEHGYHTNSQNSDTGGYDQNSLHEQTVAVLSEHSLGISGHEDVFLIQMLGEAAGFILFHIGTPPL